MERRVNAISDCQKIEKFEDGGTAAFLAWVCDRHFKPEGKIIDTLSEAHRLLWQHVSVSGESLRERL